jgi:hypothetical protein
MLVAAISISFCNHALCCFDSLFFLAWFQSSSWVFICTDGDGVCGLLQKSKPRKRKQKWLIQNMQQKY